MNWDAINAISQLISSVAVVVSVLYLAVQLRSSTRVARVAAMDAAAAALRDVTKPFMENAELGRLWRIGLENLESLSPEDQARFFHAAHQFLKALETIHYHYVYGLLDPQLWAGWRELLHHYVHSPGLRFYLSRRSDVFSERFRKFIADLEPVQNRMTVGNLLGKERSPVS
jgi:hypothetical protein